MARTKSNLPSRMKLERETFFGFNDEEDTGWVQTTSPSIMKKLSRRLGPPRVLSPGSWTWDIPKSDITLPKKRKKSGMALSERHMAVLQEGRQAFQKERKKGEVVSGEPVPNA